MVFWEIAGARTRNGSDTYRLSSRPSVFWNPAPTPANMAGFGRIYGDLNTPRQLQFGARFTF